MRIAFAVPGSLDAKTGGTIYDKRIIGGLRARGWRVDVISLDDLASVDDRTVVVVDGLSYKAGPDRIEREASRLSFVALVHLPLALEVGIDAVEAQRLRSLERRILGVMPRVIVTGRATIGMLDGYDVSADRITVVEPGTDRAPLARGSGSTTVHLLSVAAVTEGKGHGLLLRALSNVSARDWMLTCAGRIVQPIETADQRVTFAGELDDQRLAEAYDRADLFVLATLRETFGMAAAEAVAHGLPVVSTRTGSIPDIVGDGGLLVDAGDEVAMSMALGRAIGDVSLRQQLAAAARRQRARLKSWDEAVGEMADALAAVARG